MVRVYVRNQTLCSSLKKQNVTTPCTAIVLREDKVKIEPKEEVEVEEFEARPLCVLQNNPKRKRSPRFGRSDLRQIVKQSSALKRYKRESLYAGRWTSTRYLQAEESLLHIMKSEGAVFGNAMKRSDLRDSARKYIGDTGLLDHLLKHMDGKVAPGGSDRFRRWHSPCGYMEYWLESADLANTRQEAGIDDSFWVPPPGWKPGCSLSESAGVAVKLKLLKQEMNQMKRDFLVLVLKRAEDDQSNHTSSSSVCNSDSLVSMQKRIADWKGKIKKQLHEISSSLNSVQGACIDLDKWKGKIEQKILDMSIFVSIMQTSRRPNAFSPSVPDNWDFFSNADLMDPQADEFASWLGVGESKLIDEQQHDYAVVTWMAAPVKQEPDVITHNVSPVSAPETKPDNNISKEHVDATELERLREEMSKMKRNMWDVSSNKDDGLAIVTSDFSVTESSKLDFENSLHILQKFYNEVVNMKADIEKQVKELSSTIHG